MITRKRKNALAIANMLVSIAHACSARLTCRQRHAESVSDVLILAATYVGQREGRPMTAHKIAQYSGFPRPTVARKLNELQAMGLVVIENKQATFHPDLLVSRELTAVIVELSAAVRKCAAQLSKLDT